MRCLTSFVLIVALSLLAAAEAVAQTSNSRSRTGGQSTTTSRGGSTGSATGGTFGANSQIGQVQEGVGQITGEERFLRQNREAGQIVGGSTAGVGVLADQAAATDPTAANQSTGMGRTGQFGQSGQFGTRGGQFGQFGTRGGQFGQFGNMFGNQMNSNMRNRQRQTLRVPVQLGFNAATLAPAPSVVNVRVQNRLDRIPQVRGMGAVNVQMEGQVAVLRGQVATAHDRDLVAKLLLLEPGIGDVRNELVVATPATP